MEVSQKVMPRFLFHFRSESYTREHFRQLCYNHAEGIIIFQ
jgi:hypothetical protein